MLTSSIEQELSRGWDQKKNRMSWVHYQKRMETSWVRDQKEKGSLELKTNKVVLSSRPKKEKKLPWVQDQKKKKMMSWDQDQQKEVLI